MNIRRLCCDSAGNCERIQEYIDNLESQVSTLTNVLNEYKQIFGELPKYTPCRKRDNHITQHKSIAQIKFELSLEEDEDDKRMRNIVLNGNTGEHYE